MGLDEFVGPVSSGDVMGRLPYASVARPRSQPSNDGGGAGPGLVRYSSQARIQFTVRRLRGPEVQVDSRVSTPPATPFPSLKERPKGNQRGPVCLSPCKCLHDLPRRIDLIADL